jgi:hypothetical protein
LTGVREQSHHGEGDKTAHGATIIVAW